MKHLIFMAVILFFSCSKNKEISVENTEAHELANIILALTDYGMNHPTQVRKNFWYYEDVLTHFRPYQNHPLIAKVNYSNEQWKPFLSFRTDAYAFVFTPDNSLKRVNDLHFDKETEEFDKHLKLIEDFAAKSGFREFYKKHEPYYTFISKNYNRYMQTQQIIQFLDDTFETDGSANYRIVMSPLIYGSHCMREISGIKTNFVNVPDFLLNIGDISIEKLEQIKNIHVPFTEIDHAYVNPLSTQYETLINNSFDFKKWATKNAGYSTNIDTFNEYMTWAIYDIFAYTNFPEEAKHATNEWNMVQLSRGFSVMNPFRETLKTLFLKHGNIKSLYPELLAWCKTFQETIEPVAISETTIDLENHKTLENVPFEITFSSEMNMPDVVEVYLYHYENEKEEREKIQLSKEGHQLNWIDNGRKMSFRLNLIPETNNILIFNYYGLSSLQNKNGIDLEFVSRVIVEKNKFKHNKVL